MKILIFTAAFVLLAIVVLPLRRITETSYISPPQKLTDGSPIRIEFDPTYSGDPESVWYGSLKGGSPYRIRLIVKPESLRAPELIVENIAVRNRDGQILAELPSKNAVGVQRDGAGDLVLIVGYPNVTLEGENITAELKLKFNGLSQSVRFELRRNTRNRVIHAGWAALNSV